MITRINIILQKTPLFTQKPLRVFSLLTAFLFLIGLVMIIIKIGSFPNSLVLHFDAFRGIDKLGIPSDAWVLWGIGFAISAMNGFLSHRLFNRERTLSFFFGSINIFIGLIIVIALATLVHIN